MEEIDIRQITVPDNSHSVFIGKLPMPHPREEVMQRIRDVWENLWHNAGVERPPPLLLMPNDFEIEPISDAELRKLGLMRVPEPTGE